MMVKDSKVCVISIGGTDDQEVNSNDDSHSCTSVQNIAGIERSSVSSVENQNNREITKTRSSFTCRCLQAFKNFHFKNWRESDIILKLFRLLAIIGLFVCASIDTVMYWKNSQDKPDSLQFTYGSLYIPVEVLTMIYSSGVAAFGISIEVYIIVIHAIANTVLATQTCGSLNKTVSEITWTIKLILFFPAVELCYRNFHKLQNYKEHFNSSARSMLRQALFIGIALLGQNLQGLRALYHGTNMRLPRFCRYETRYCGIVNLYEPLFSYEDDMCSDDLSAYVSGREQIRLLRNFILINIATYSVFNKHFLKINAHAKYLWVRILLIILFVALSTSIPISYIDPFFFIKNCRIVYFIIEGNIFAIILILMAYNLYRLRKTTQNPSSEIGEMVKSPPLLP